MRDHIVDVRIAQHRNDRTELFLRHQSCVVGDVPDDRWLNEVTLPAEYLAAGNDLAVPLGVLEVALNLLELRLVLQRAHLRPLFQPITDH